MTAEHLRRVLSQTPDLPQGRVGTDGGTRWFTLTEVDILRRHFSKVAARHTGRGKIHGPIRPPGARAPLIALAGPLGRTGRSGSLLHLACAAALGGYRILVLDADPAGRLAADLGADIAPLRETTLMPLIARSCGVHLRQVNAGRLDRGEPPLPMDEVIAAALEQTVADLIRPTVWPGLDVIAAAPELMLADSQINTWRSTSRSWHPAKALAAALDREGLRDRYDLILCDTGRGLGPLVLSVLTSADIMLIPQAASRDSGLTSMIRALQDQEAEATMTARALGQSALRLNWRAMAGLTVNLTSPDPRSRSRVGARAESHGPALLPDPLPYISQVADEQAAHFYALDYRAVGRLPYAPLRDACNAAWRGVEAIVATLWAEDAQAHSESKSLI